MSPFRPDDWCEWFRERLELFLDGELSGSENFRFQQHLKDCEDCAGHWAEDEAISEALLVGYAPALADEGLLPPAGQDPPRVPRVGEERSVSHHSTTVVVQRGAGSGRLLALAAAALVVALVVQVADRRDRAPRVTAGARTVAAAAGEQPRIYAQGRVEYRNGVEDWRPLVEPAAIRTGVELRAGRDSRLLVDLGDRDHFVLGEDSLGRIADLDGALRFEVRQGSFSCDLAGRALELESAGLEISGRDLGFDLRTAGLDEALGWESRIAVTRGALQARSELGAARRLVDGDVYVVRDGVLVAFDRLETEYDEVMLATRSRTDLGAAIDEAPTDMTGVRGEVVAMPLASARHRIERWLERIVAEGGLNIVDPDRASRRLMEQIAIWGEPALQDVEALYREADDALARRALVGLVGAIRGEGARRFLVAAAEDADLRVRKASLLCLSRRPGEGLGKHFLAVMSRETDTDLRLSAAFLAAVAGEAEGFTAMRALHGEAASRYWRQTVVVLAARLDREFPGREDFLFELLEGFEPTEGLPLLETLLGALVDAGDRERLARALRARLADPRLTPAMRRALESAGEGRR